MPFFTVGVKATHGNDPAGSAAGAVNLYKDHGAEIFKRRLAFWNRIKTGLKYGYSAGGLKKVLHGVFGNR